MKLSTDVKIILGISLVTVLILSIGVFLLSKNSTPTSEKVDQSLLINSTSHQTASASAKVTVVEFGDYQCPACGAAYPTTKRVINDYKGKINFVFRNFAFIGQESNWAAEAAECSAEQGKFWEYHDYLYEHQGGENRGAFSKDHLKEFAKFLNLDTKQFNACLDSDRTSSIVTSDTSDGQRVGVNSTPTFFINGEKFVGVLNYEDFKSRIESKIK